MKFNRYWFKPKRFGYGAYPVTWEGWLVVLVAVAAIVLLSRFITPENTLHFLGAVLILGIGLSWISRVKTKEPWKWRWGQTEWKKSRKNK